MTLSNEPTRPPTIALVGAGVLGWMVGDLLGRDPHCPHLLVSDPAPPEPRLRAALRLEKSALTGSAGEALVRHLHQRGHGRRVGTLAHWSDLDSCDPLLTIVASATPEPDRAISEHLLRHDLPHLVVRLSAGRARIGPLVEPGRSPCLRCLDTTITDTDPSWPTRLLTRTARPLPARAVVDATVANWAAAVAAVQVRSYVATGRADVTGCTLELGAAELITRVRRWTCHPRCGCAWWRD